MKRRIEVALHDGTLVLGKNYKGEPCALTYANRTQADNAAQKEPDGEVIRRGRPFYVRLKLQSDDTRRGIDSSATAKQD